MTAAEKSPEAQRSRRAFKWKKPALCGLALLLVAAWVVPKIDADRYREPVRAALERALGRKVEFSQVKFRLLPLPGFTVTNLRVGEDPAIGAEPVAYVGTVHAVPRITSLFTGRPALASVDLEDASVTLTRVERSDSGMRWNFASMMRPTRAAAFPSVHMRSGRVDFKFGDRKSIFYLLNTDVDLWPPSRANGAWTIRAHAQPARTDRPARGFGYFSARGEWRRVDNSLTLDVRLEQSELGDMLTLFEGRESGVMGEIRGDAHLAGPLNRVGVRGRLTLENIHGWNESPPAGDSWPVWLSGFVDASGQAIDVRATLAQKQPPLDLRYRVSDYLGRPKWGVTAIFNRMPVAPLVAVARNLGVRIPAGVGITGAAEGAVSYAMPAGEPRLDGQVAISDLTISSPDTPALRVEPAQLTLSGSSVALGPATMSDAAGEVATVGLAYDIATGKANASIATSGMSIAALRRRAPTAGLPLLGIATSGSWSGALAWSDAGWTGNIRLTNADVPFEAFSQPLHIRSAEAAIDGPAMALRHVDLAAGGMEASGEYRYEPGAVRPHRFRLNIPVVDAAALEKLFSPALRRGSFLNYAFNFGRPPQPEWLTTMAADGVVQAGELDLGPVAVTRLRARVLWDGAAVRLADLQSTVAGGAFTGDASVDVSQREPRYRFAGAVAGLPWRSGSVDAQGEASTHGFGAELAGNLQAAGSFRGRSVELGAAESWDAAAGCFEWAWSRGNPRLKLMQLVLTSAGETWLGSAETASNGELVLNLADGDKKLQTSEALFGPPRQSAP